MRSEFDFDDFTFVSYQEQAHSFAVYPPEVWQDYPIMGLLEECGEVAGTSKRFLRGDYDLKEYLINLKKELGDVLWYLSEICTANNWSLSDIASDNLKKLQDRKIRGVIKGSGDDR